MPGKYWTADELVQLDGFVQAGTSWVEAGRALGRTPDAVRMKAGAIARDAETERPPRTVVASSDPLVGRVSIEGDEHGGLTIEAYRDAEEARQIKTIEEFLEVAEVDLERYRLVRHLLNKWPVGAKGPNGRIIVTELWQVKAWLEPREDVETLDAVLESLYERIREAAPPAPLPAYPEREGRAAGRLLEICPTDLHFGMLSWAAETGEAYDSEIARWLFLESTRDIVRQAVERGGFERILLILGNDGQHSDRTNGGSGGTTTAGTPLDVDTRRPKMVNAFVDMLLEIIVELREGWPVDILYVPGNHDADSSALVARVLSERFHADAAVTVYADPAPILTYRWGAVGLGFTHKPAKSSKDAALELERLFRDETGIRWLEIQHGHLHRVSVEEVHGVRIRVVGTIAARDAWAAWMLYFHQRVAEGFLWHRERLYEGSACVSAAALEQLRAAS